MKPPVRLDDLVDPGEEGAPMGSRRELVNLTWRALEAERLLSERTRELTVFSAQGHIANFLLREGELLALADELDSQDEPGCECAQCQLVGSTATKIRVILRLPS